MYLKKDEIVSGETLLSKSNKGGRNLNSSVKLKPIYDSQKQLQSDPSLQSLTPRDIIPNFHRKSHFKALTSVFLKQGYGAQIINTERKDDGKKGAPDTSDDNKFVEKLMMAVSKNQNNQQRNSSVSPHQKTLTQKSSMVSAGYAIS